VLKSRAQGTTGEYQYCAKETGRPDRTTREDHKHAHDGNIMRTDKRTSSSFYGLKCLASSVHLLKLAWDKGGLVAAVLSLA
jgi:hypothetical protein